MMRLQNVLNCTSSLIDIPEILKGNRSRFAVFNPSGPSQAFDLKTGFSYRIQALTENS